MSNQPILEVGSRVIVFSGTSNYRCGEFKVTKVVHNASSSGTETLYHGEKLAVGKNGEEVWHAGHQWGTSRSYPFTWSFATSPTPNKAVSKVCPRCGAATTTKTNSYTSKQFTGCSSWPRCSWTTDGVYMSAKTDVGQQIKFQTNKGPIVGTVIGTNNNDNVIIRVDKKSPIKGFKLSADMMHTVEDYADARYARGLKGYTFWHISKNDEVEEATDADLLQDPVEEKKEAKAVAAGKAAQDNFAEKFEKAVDVKSAIKESKMSEKKNAVQMIKSDGEAAALRVAGKRISSAANAVVCKALKGSLGPEHAASVEAIMKTPVGTALTQLTMGWGLTYLPGSYAQDARVQKLAEEFRIQGTAEGMDMVVGALMTHLEPVVRNALEMLPGGEVETAEKARIAAPGAAPSVHTEETEEVLELSDVPVEGKKASVGK